MPAAYPGYYIYYTPIYNPYSYFPVSYPCSYRAPYNYAPYDYRQVPYSPPAAAPGMYSVPPSRN